ncbi:ABC transporter permease [Algoriphagus machipongonensis]|uniref:ABC transporter, permease protein n=1 Tax=Algoriphagus machipongonensis TaxID=388413 RepID=A3I1J9_9BACT|nr:ABC transporter permease [Algoriphagus machipongonensis]EAZ79665.1 putative ABC transporter, permease protein [Algoriphagus machipongonensis]
MLKNYFKIAYRNLLKKKVYSFINIVGLGIGMACCVLIFMFVQDELSYDQFNEKGDRIFRVVHGYFGEDEQVEVNSRENYWVWGNAPVGPALELDFPEVEKVVRFSGRADILFTIGDQTQQEEGIVFMDSTFFDVFSYELLEGDPKNALVAPFSVVLSETTARKYFGDQEALGKTLKGSDVAGRADAGDYTVTGVMKDLPSNSHLQFNTLLSLSTFHQSRPGVFDAWGYVDTYTYFLVNEQFDQQAFEAKIPEFLERRASEENGPNYTIGIEPLKDVYLRSEVQRQPGDTSSLSNIYVFSVIGLFILGIAIINFMNLSTARSMERAKEVGIRKSIGADKNSLIFQFLGESLIIVILSALVAVVFVSAALPMMNDITGKELLVGSVLNWQTVPFFLGIILIVGLLAGSYPALVLSSFRPVMILKGINKSDARGVNLRKGLVVFQFSLSIALIAGTLIVYSQMSHLLDKDMGFDKEQMVIVDYNYDEQVNNVSSALESELEKNPNIESVAFSRSVPGSHFPNAGTFIENPEGEMVMIGQAIFQVGLDFIDHFNLELVAGRSYSRDYPSDSTSALVINEAAARQYGYANPADIVGKKFDQWGREGEVIGVVKDFNYISLHNKVEPLTLPFEAYASRFMSLKVKGENIPATLAEIDAVWSELAPHRPFIYSFLDEDFNTQYESDFRFRQIFTTFSVLAILIACLGLLGLATYTAEQRTKEIGIRKVLGANIGSIVGLLSKDFIQLVLIAILVATPVAWYAMNQWLEGFAYQVPVHWWVFLVSGMLAVVVALVTISFQAIKAAMLNPVKSLKSE